MTPSIVANLILKMSSLGWLNAALQQYLSKIQSSAPPTIAPIGDYVPPFAGGQCSTNYMVVISYIDSASVVREQTYTSLSGAIIAPNIIGNNWGFTHMSGANRIRKGVFDTDYYSLYSFVVSRVDGLPDNCGNLPNPNPIAINPDGGMVDGAYAPIASNQIVPAALPVLAPSAITAILAALRNAANLAILAAQLADALKAILDFLKEIEDKDPSKKAIKSRDLGAIEKDGFLRLYPSVRGDSIAINLDLRFYSIPSWKRDTILGNKSPNRYHNLGRILFVSETLGIINEIELVYTINSIPIPENAIGFYYHLGLDGIAKAYSTAFYLE